MIKPWVIVNAAISADGKIASAGGAIGPLGSPEDRRLLLRLRAGADAVMAGARTVAAHPMTLGVGKMGGRWARWRARRGQPSQPLRIVVSGRLSLRADAAIFQQSISPVLVLTTARASNRRLVQMRRLAEAVEPFGKEEVDWERAFFWLRRRWGIRRLICEGGGELNDALFRGGWVDELYLTICPFVVGGGSAPTLADGLGAPALAHAASFTLQSMRRIGSELFVRFTKRTGRRSAAL